MKTKFHYYICLLIAYLLDQHTQMLSSQEEYTLRCFKFSNNILYNSSANCWFSELELIPIPVSVKLFLKKFANY